MRIAQECSDLRLSVAYFLLYRQMRIAQECSDLRLYVAALKISDGRWVYVHSFAAVSSTDSNPNDVRERGNHIFTQVVH
jgi:hypothetical protein